MKRLYRRMLVIAGLLVVTVCMGCAATQKHESTGQYLDDSVITTKVKAAIFNEPSLKTLQINVKTLNAKVQLSGSVDSALSMSKAGEVAGQIAGVISVENNLALQ